MKYLGEKGYLDIARIVMDTKKIIMEGIESIEGLQLLTESKIGIVTFGSREFDIFTVADEMDNRKWYTARIKEPPAMHLVVTPANSPVVDDFLAVLGEIVGLVKTGQLSHTNQPVEY
jgi:glutamate/tyrosine decarboxylase-like PLP-dependent enzyme